MRLAVRRRRDRRSSPGLVGQPRPLYVACIDLPAPVRQRLDTIGRSQERRLVITDAGSGGGFDATSVRWAEVIVVGVADEDARGAAVIGEIVRSVPSARVVVVGESTRWFDEAFELGADVWIDAAADDRTVRLAVMGEA